MTRKTFLLSLACAALALPLATAASAAQETGFLNRTATADGKSLPYVVYVPKGYTPDKKWPVILFLHGAGERGDDGLKQSQVGLGAALRFFPERYPAIAVMPQCPTGQNWSRDALALAVAALDQTEKEFSCDLDRQYLTGLSMGGYGSWLLASQRPDRFAAVVPVCGGGDPKEMAAKLTGVPIWVYHGDADQAVPVQRSRDMVEAIKAAGGAKIKYTELPGVPHNSWDACYSSKDVAEWLFSQKRGG